MASPQYRTSLLGPYHTHVRTQDISGCEPREQRYAEECCDDIPREVGEQMWQSVKKYFYPLEGLHMSQERAHDLANTICNLSTSGHTF